MDSSVGEEGTKRVTDYQKKWSTFVESCTLHGLQHVFTSQTPWVRRILWALFLAAAIVWFSFQSSKLLKKYFSYPATTKVSLVYEGSPEFPAVSICNFNRFKKSVIMAKGYDQPLSQYEKKVLGFDTENNTTDFGKDGKSILKVKEAGSVFGLGLILNVRRDEYYGATTYQTGFKILIHHQGTPPLVSQLGFAVGPGTSTFAAIRKQRVLNLPDPHESNCFNEAVSSIPGYPKYTIPSCMLICQTKFVIEKCGCREVGMPDIYNTKVCDLNEAAACVVKAQNNFYELKDYQCDCPVPCDSITFKHALSYAAFPRTNYVVSVAKVVPHLETMTPEVLKLTEEYISQNYVLLNIYFQELNYQLIQETPAYDSESLLAEIGGQLGLCVGASLLTVLEFIDVIFSMIKLRLGFG